MISVIVPAHNERRHLGACLQALLASDPVVAEVIIVANGCTDDTVAVAQGFRAGFEAAGWGFQVLELVDGGKPGALNAGDAAARYSARVYLDADVAVEPAMMAAFATTLDNDAPVYASGKVVICADGLVSRRYARLWARLPFMATGVPGCGLFAVNGAARARWQEFPEVISDDTFVRLQFTPAERRLVSASYNWPIAEGFGALVKVRRRQDAGVVEIAQRFPALLANDTHEHHGVKGIFRLAMTDPMGFATYALVAVAVKILPAPKSWSRGR